MEPESQARGGAPAKVEERRHCTRHRYIEGLYIGKEDGTWFTAMTYEISVGGLSAATTTPLRVGETVHWSPVVGKPVEAIVCRKQGAMYGFEFIDLSPKVAEQLEKLCEGLPLFRSMIDVSSNSSLPPAGKKSAGALRSGTCHKSDLVVSGGTRRRENCRDIRLHYETRERDARMRERALCTHNPDGNHSPVYNRSPDGRRIRGRNNRDTTGPRR
jgi:hypothetical protein